MHYNTPKNISAYRKFVIIVAKTGRELVILPGRMAEFCRRHDINYNAAVHNSIKTPDRNIPLRYTMDSDQTVVYNSKYGGSIGKDTGLVLLAKNHPKSHLK